MLNEVVDIAIHCSGDITPRVANTMVGNAVLREVVGTDFLAAVAGTYQASALGGCPSIFFVDFFVQLGAAVG